MRVHGQHRHVGGARQRVVHQRAGEKLAGLRVIGHALQQRLADALRNAAMRLAVHEQRIDHAAHIVHRRIARDARGTGLGIDLDLAHVAAIGERQPLGAVFEIAGKLARGRARHFAVARRGGGFGQGHGAIGAAHAERAARELDVLRRRFEHVARDRRALFDQSLRGAEHRAAGHAHRARAVRAGALLDQRRVAEDHAHRSERHAEAFGHHLREARLVPLAVIVRADKHRHASVRLRAQFRVFERLAAGALDIAADSAAIEHAAPPRFGLPRGEAVPVGGGLRFRHHRREVAAVVVGAGRRLVGHRRGWDEIAPAQFERVDAGGARRRLDQALHRIDRLGAADAAIGVHRRAIRERGAQAQMRGRHGVDAGGEPHDVDRRRPMAERRDAGADVVQRFELHREEAAIGVERERGLDVLVAALRIGEEALGAVGAPFHGPAEEARRNGGEDVLGIEIAARAEAAADIVGDHAKPLGRHAEHLRKHEPLALHALRSAAKRDTLRRRIVLDQGHARLHVMHDEPVVEMRHAHHMRGRREGALRRRRVAVLGVEAEIVRQLVPDPRRIGRQRPAGFGDGRELFVLHRDALGGVLRQRARLGDDERHRLAGIAHLAARKRIVRRIGQRRAVAIEERRCGLARPGRDRLHALALQIARGQNEAHALDLAGA